VKGKKFLDWHANEKSLDIDDIVVKLAAAVRKYK
jgi:hypothetical protein